MGSEGGAVEDGVECEDRRAMTCLHPTVFGMGIGLHFPVL